MDSVLRSLYHCLHTYSSLFSVVLVASVIVFFCSYCSISLPRRDSDPGPLSRLFSLLATAVCAFLFTAINRMVQRFLPSSTIYLAHGIVCRVALTLLLLFYFVKVGFWVRNLFRYYNFHAWETIIKVSFLFEEHRDKKRFEPKIATVTLLNY